MGWKTVVMASALMGGLGACEAGSNGNLILNDDASDRASALTDAQICLDQAEVVRILPKGGFVLNSANKIGSDALRACEAAHANAPDNAKIRAALVRAIDGSNADYHRIPPLLSDREDEATGILDFTYGLVVYRGVVDAPRAQADSAVSSAIAKSFDAGHILNAEDDNPREVRVAHYRLAEAAGFADAAYKIGNLYFYEKHGEIDYDLAKAAYLRADELGYGEAAVQLGYMAENGLGEDADPVKAAELYIRAAERESLVGLCNAGYVLEEGIGTDADPERAVEFYERGAALGKLRCLSRHGVMLFEGDGVDPERVRGFGMILDAANRGHADGASRLGEIYRQGKHDVVEPDLDRARQYYLVAAETEHAFSLSELGEFYEDGIGVEPDLEKAVAYYERAASQGHRWTQARLGQMLIDGRGTAFDESRGVRLMLAAAEAGQDQGVEGLKPYRKSPARMGLDPDLRAELEAWLDRN